MEESMKPKVVAGKILLQVPVSRRLQVVSTTSSSDWRNYFKQMVEQVPEDIPEEVKQDYIHCYYAIENAVYYGGIFEKLQCKGNNLVEMFFTFYDMRRLTRYLNSTVCEDISMA